MVTIWPCRKPSRVSKEVLLGPHSVTVRATVAGAKIRRRKNHKGPTPYLKKDKVGTYIK